MFFDDDLDQRLSWEITVYLINCRARNLSPKTIKRYKELLDEFAGYWESDNLAIITSNDIRLFIVHLQETGHNPAGVWTYYRTLKTFFRWLYAEEVLEKDLFQKIKVPHVPEVILPPIELEDVGKLIKVCKGKNFTAIRDKAIIYTLLDTGLRASEFVAVQQNDLDLDTGAVIVRAGKGRKRRTVFIKPKARQATGRYLRKVKQPGALWQSEAGQPLKYSGLRQIIRRRSAQANIKCPSLHAFRRAFAINSLRNGMDLISLQRLMGHSNLDVLYRYLSQLDEDLSEAHAKYGPSL